MRASHLVSAFHQRLSTGSFLSPVPARECRGVRSIATSLTITKETPNQKNEQPEPQRKEPKARFVAVLVGREGPKIYSSWKQCEPHVTGYSGASMKSFRTVDEAEAWYISRLGRLPQQNNHIDSSAKNQKPKTQGVPLPISTVPVNVEPGLSYTEITNGDTLNGGPILSGVMDTKEVLPGSEQEVEHTPLLSDEQRSVIESARQGKSIFFTGSAGTGKSFTLRELIRVLRNDNAGKGVYVTASTGIAAVNIGGSTLHSYAGIGLGKGPLPRLKCTALSNRDAAARWVDTKVLVIDEISMVDGDFFDKLEEIARYVRCDKRPFGGIQLVVCGDFFQLPPVPQSINGQNRPITFAFDAVKWPRCIQENIALTKVYRQQEGAFVDFLNSMRYGIVSPQAHAVLASLERNIHYRDGIEPMQLFSLRAQVERANIKKLLALKSELRVYKATDSPGPPVKGKKISFKRASKLADQTLAVRSLMLKVGAQVMLIMNIAPDSYRLVNGTFGIITGFLTIDEAERRAVQVLRIGRDWTVPATDQRQWPVVRFTNSEDEFLLPPLKFRVVNGLGNVEAVRVQVPLTLAWAMSIHKSQGQTLPRVKVDLSGTFEKGQAYVAISRATSLETLQVSHFHPSKVLPHPRVIEWSSQLRTVATASQTAADSP